MTWNPTSALNNLLIDLVEVAYTVKALIKCKLNIISSKHWTFVLTTQSGYFQLIMISITC